MDFLEEILELLDREEPLTFEDTRAVLIKYGEVQEACEVQKKVI